MIELIKDLNKLEGTAYFEFFPGKYKNKCWNKESVFIDEESFGLIEPIFERCIEKYDHYAFVAVNRKKWERVIDELLSLQEKVRGLKGVDDLQEYIGLFSTATRERFAESFEKNREDLDKLIEDLVAWLRRTLKNYEGISILGL
jgi:hypothetical protein